MELTWLIAALLLDPQRHGARIAPLGPDAAARLDASLDEQAVATYPAAP
jgi:hypothetical protein